MIIDILNIGCLEGARSLDTDSIDGIVTSPPYWGLRSYGGEPGMIGLEPTFSSHLARLIELFRELRRVLKSSGSLWVNYGDAYSGGGITQDNRRPKKSSMPDPKSINRGMRLAPEPGGGPRSKTGDERNVERKATDLPSGCLLGMAWRLALALVDDGWILRQDIIWHKPNPMPESVRNRCTRSHEYLFHFVKRMGYYWNHEVMREPVVTPERYGNRPSVKRGEFNGKTEEIPGRNAFRAVGDTRNRRDVWSIVPNKFPGAHFATFPPELIRPAILASCPPGGLVVDPFAGAGTVGLVCAEEGRRFVGFEINAGYCEMARKRFENVQQKLTLPSE